MGENRGEAPGLELREGQAVTESDPSTVGVAVLLVDETGRVLARAPAGERLGASPTEALRRAVAEALRTGEAARLGVEIGDGEGWPHEVSGVVLPLAPAVSQPLAAVILRPASSALPEGGEEDARAEVRRAIGEIAHELARPLSAVLSYAELALADPELPEVARTRLAMVVEHAEACRQIIHRSLEIGLAAVSPAEPVDLNAVVRRATASIAHVIDASGVELTLRLAPSVPEVSGAAPDLTAAVRNLLENAVEAASAHPRLSSSPSPRVEVQTEATATGLRLTVRDTGPGLDPAIAGRIFEPFVSTKDADQATGLGLSLVRRIALEHGGQVTAASPPEGGAVFVLELPVSRVPVAMPPPPVPEAVAPPAERGPLRVLVIDDDASMRQLLKAYLDTLGYEATEAGDGEEGLRAAVAGGYDVIICDIKMPCMDGLEFHRRLYAASPERAQLVIFSTGVLPSDPAFESLSALGRPHLRKPYRLASLKAALAALRGDG